LLNNFTEGRRQWRWKINRPYPRCIRLIFRRYKPV